MTHLQNGSIKPTVACLPVTALHVIDFNGTAITLSGSGSLLSASGSRGSGESFAITHRIFEAQSIHGVLSEKPTVYHGETVARLFVWGGRCWAVVKLTLLVDDIKKNSSIALNVQHRSSLNDWILSAFVDRSASKAMLLTAHNSLYQISLTQEINHCYILLAEGLRTLLYSGSIVAGGSNQLIIASGTVFGEIIVWTCSLEEQPSSAQVLTRHIFLGHKGSIFGVCLSSSFECRGSQRRLLASCSDDRTVRIWDVSDCEALGGSVTKYSVDDLETGFGVEHSSDTCIAMGWGHTSRIWRVYFLEKTVGPLQKDLQILSRGEDGVCQRWTVQIEDLFMSRSEGVVPLLTISNDRYHAGKHAWSLTYVNTPAGYDIFTGGADGRIVCRSILTCPQVSSRLAKIRFREVISSAIGHDSVCSAKSLKKNLLLDTGTVLATTDMGNVLMRGPGEANHWSAITLNMAKGPVTLSSNHAGKLAFLGTSDGIVLMLDTDTHTVTNLPVRLPGQASWIQIVHSSLEFDIQQVSLIINLHGKYNPRLLMVTISASGITIRESELDLSSDFVICSAAYHRDRRLLVCGSRAGAIALVQDDEGGGCQDRSIKYMRHVHGSDHVTCVLFLQDGDFEKDSSFIVTTGRDGTWAMHRLDEMLDTRGLSLVTVHRSTPPFGPLIEGVSVHKQDLGYSLQLHGFRSSDFVVWDEKGQTPLTSVDCGGAHRSWSYTSQCLTAGGAFVWFQAGHLNEHMVKKAQHRIIKTGGHGREIKALAMASSSHTDATILFATGAEDTDIRLWHYTLRHNSSHELKCLSVLKGHDTGLQDLKFSSCGTYLFSSGGSEEFFVWRMHVVPIIEIGSVLTTKLQKKGDDADARIMSFDVIDRSDETFSISMAYSNGRVKIYTLSRSDDSLISRREFTVGEICLTQASFLNDENILVGATDGNLRLFSHTHSAMIVATATQRVHQSNIASMETSQLQADLHLVATGGDDNALGITLLQLHNSQRDFHTTLVPDAHAAAVTAVSIIHTTYIDDKIESVVVSAGNDQMVKVWRVQYQMKSTDTMRADDDTTPSKRISLSIQKLQEQWTDVADISSMKLLLSSTAPRCTQVLVVGVGMQVIDIGPGS